MELKSTKESKSNRKSLEPMVAPRPSASVTIEPKGRRVRAPREHLIKLVIDLSGGDPKHADKAHVMAVAREGFAPFAPTGGAADRRKFTELVGRAGGVATGIEASVPWSASPTEAAIAQLRAALTADGYRVTVREIRECSHSKCATELLFQWNQPAAIPPGWYRSTICGKHQYRTCGKCQSVYVMSSVNAAGHAPSVHCVVCSSILVEWGSSKVWSAKLVSRGDAGPEATAADFAAEAAGESGEA